MPSSFFRSCAAALFLIAITAQPALAQSVQDNILQHDMPVDERAPESLQHKIYNYRGFSYFADLQLEGEYNTNILAESRDESSDFITRAKPLIIVRKAYDGHVAIFGSGANIERHMDLKNEDKEDFYLFTRGRLVPSNSLQIPFNIRLDRADRKRESPRRQSLSEEPISVRRFLAETGFIKRFNRLSVGMLGTYRDTSFEDQVSAVNGQPVINSDLDRKSYRGTLTFKYEIPSEKEALAEYTFYTDLYAQHQDFARGEFRNGSFSGDNATNDGYGFLSGFKTNYKGFLFADLGLGYLSLRYNDEDLEDISILDLHADVKYNVTPKATLNFRASRDVSQDNGFIQGVTETAYKAGLDYELQHNMYLGGDLEHVAYVFEEVDRLDEDDWIGRLNFRYLHSAHFESNIELMHMERNSDDEEFAFDRSVILLRFIGKL